MAILLATTGRLAAAEPAATPHPGEVEVDALEEHGARPEESPAAPSAEATPVGPWPRLRFYWSRGLNYELRQHLKVGKRETPLYETEASLTGRVGIKLGVDAAAYASGGGLREIDDAINLRRFFVYTTGEFRLVVPVLFKVDFGVVEEDFYFSDIYIWFRDVPYVGTVKLGQFDAPMSFESVTGSTDQTFMEYGSPVQAFVPGLKAGIQIADHRDDERATWAVGYFTNAQETDVGDASESVARLVGRATWVAAMPATAADVLCHVGGSASYVLSTQEDIRYRSRPESFLAPVLVDTGELGTNSAFPFGLEFALTRGPLTLQAEYLASLVDGVAGVDPIFAGMYASGSWFLTGERRPYDFAAGKFGHIVPARPLSWSQRRWGAWEVAARLSYVDLSDDGVRGGAMLIGTGGLNWYLDRYVRLMFNTNFASLRDGPNAGRLGIFQMRFQLVF